MTERFDPVAALAAARHEFGEHGGVNPSIEQSTTFTVMHPETMPEIFHGHLGPQQGCYLYGRHFNPTVIGLGHQLAAMESAEVGYCTASGMGAIATTLLHLCRTGDHIVSSGTVYGGTFALMKNFLPERSGIHTTFVNTDDLDTVEAAFTERTKVLYVESMSNPTLRVADIQALAAVAHRNGAKLVVDNTFTPMILTPIRHGADVVVHSLTKFVSGASDVIAGAVLGSKDFIEGLMDVNDGSLMLLGPTMDPHVAFQLGLRLPHLGVRMAEHGRRARTFAERLRERGTDVVYPGLPDDPHHDRLVRQANPGYGLGGILGVDLRTSARADRFMDLLQNEGRFGLMAVSLGYFETLLSCSAESTSSELGDEAQGEAGISPGLVRMSVGYTGTLEQRWSQLERVLELMDREERRAG